MMEPQPEPVAGNPSFQGKENGLSDGTAGLTWVVVGTMEQNPFSFTVIKKGCDRRQAEDDSSCHGLRPKLPTIDQQ